MASYGTPHPAGMLISITFTKQEMSHLCGLSRVRVSQIFAALEKEGVIVAVGRQVAIPDTARLASLAQN
jgi:CRP-like cAMP-binding protein